MRHKFCWICPWGTWKNTNKGKRNKMIKNKLNCKIVIQKETTTATAKQTPITFHYYNTLVVINE